MIAGNMDTKTLADALQPERVIARDGIWFSKEALDETVWDQLAAENPTNAVISAENEAAAAEKSKMQIQELRQHLSADDVLLDLGSGYGRVAQYLLPEQPLAGYIGMDSSPHMLSLFKERYGQQPAEQQTPLLLLNADIHAIPLQDQSVDVVIVCAVFLHNHKSVVKKSMAELKRVLKPGGTLFVYSSFPRAATLMGLQGLAYQKLLDLTGRGHRNGPVRYYWRREVAQLLNGFSEVDFKPVGFAVVPKALLILPGPLDKIYRVGFANPINRLLKAIMPARLRPYCATHLDVVAKW